MRVMVAVVLAAVLLAGCGGDDGEVRTVTVASTPAGVTRVVDEAAAGRAYLAWADAGNPRLRAAVLRLRECDDDARCLHETFTRLRDFARHDRDFLLAWDAPPPVERNRDEMVRAVSRVEVLADRLARSLADGREALGDDQLVAELFDTYEEQTTTARLIRARLGLPALDG